jgi:hypothetical protein
MLYPAQSVSEGCSPKIGADERVEKQKQVIEPFLGEDGDEGGDDPVLAPLDPAAAVFRTQASGRDPMDVSEEEARAPGGASAPAGSEDCTLPDFSEMSEAGDPAGVRGRDLAPRARSRSKVSMSNRRTAHASPQGTSEEGRESSPPAECFFGADLGGRARLGTGNPRKASF